MNGIQAALEAKLTADPEARYTPSGKFVLQLAAQVVEQRQQDAPPTWIRISVWEQMAELLQHELVRGSTIYAEGRLTLNRWRGSDGGEKSGLNLSAQRLDVIGAVGRSSTRPAPAQHPPSPVHRPMLAGRPANVQPTSGGRPSDDDAPIGFDAPRPIRLSETQRRIAQAAGEGQQRAMERRPWRR